MLAKVRSPVYHISFMILYDSQDLIQLTAYVVPLHALITPWSIGCITDVVLGGK